MALVTVAAAAMCALSFFLGHHRNLTGDLGICMPSPNQWHIDPLLSWILNTCILAIIALGTHLLNRHYNYIRSTQPVMPAMFLLMTCSVPWLTEALNASTLVCVLNLMSLSVLFSCYRRRNATQEMFVIGTFFSLGSMCQYAFIPYIPVYAVSGIIMKAFRFKEFLAMGMGIIAPYWVGMGLGLITPGDFTLPEFSNLFDGYADHTDLFMLLVSVGLAAFSGLLLGLNNAIKLYAGNSRINALNLAVSLTGLVSIICIILDFRNMTAYVATMFMTVAAQFANLCALWTIKREWLVVFIPGVIYAIIFTVMLLTG